MVSHPAWVCGLKQFLISLCFIAVMVTPCVGVWIETYPRIIYPQQSSSHPAWVCGLKRLSYACITFPPGSHPAWVCGLKLFPICQLSVANASHPAWVCGLKPLRRYEIYPHGWSHPAWVGGLKPAQILNANITTSHTLRGCVDWNRLLTKNGCDCIVTPCVGVWIETYLPADVRLSPMSHPAWVCGLKLLQYWLLYIHEKSHPAWVCGLKLPNIVLTLSPPSHTLRGCVDWNNSL